MLIATAAAGCSRNWRRAVSSLPTRRHRCRTGVLAFVTLPGGLEAVRMRIRKFFAGLSAYSRHACCQMIAGQNPVHEAYLSRALNASAKANVAGPAIQNESRGKRRAARFDIVARHPRCYC
jgi:hypothetical protein